MTMQLRVFIALQLTLSLTFGASLRAADSTDVDTDSGPRLEEIIVTAQKREQNINDVGIAITELIGDTIKSLGIETPKDLASSVSNMSVSTLNSDVPNFSIRGVGVNDYAINQATSVGVYVDQVFLASPAMLLFQIFDIDNVQVLKGPQGTLYGRNTTAGAILFTSKAPTDTFEASTYEEAGNYAYYSVEGAVSGPLSDTVAARVAVNSTQSNGYQQLQGTGLTNGGIDRTAVRSIIDWKPIEDLKVRLNVHAGVDKSNPISFNTDGFGNNTLSAGTVDTYNGLPERDNDAKGASLVADWTLTPVVLTSVSSYEQLHRFEYENQDGRPANPPLIDAILGSYLRSFSQELRLASSSSGPLTWVGGLYYSKDEINDSTTYQVTGAGYTPTDFGIDSPYPLVTSLGNTYYETTISRAVFGQVEWDPLAKLHLTAGARYTKEDKELDNVTTPYSVDPGAGQIGPVQTGTLFPAASYSRDFSAVSGKVGADYHLTQDALVYASISRGFKSGGFPGTLVFDPANLHYFNPETVLDYEIGTKLTLSDGRLQINGAAFYYDYKNLQAQGTIAGGANGVTNLFALQNIGNAVNFGGELDVQAVPTERLHLSAGIGYLDARITDPFVIEVRPGGKPALAPTWNSNGRARYTVLQTAAARWFVQADYTFQTAEYFDIYETPFMKQPAYWVWNGEVGVESNDGKWSATVWDRNLADRQYRSGAFDGGTAGPISLYAPPRTFGISFSFHFH